MMSFFDWVGTAFVLALVHGFCARVLCALLRLLCVGIIFPMRYRIVCVCVCVLPELPWAFLLPVLRRQ